MRKNSIFLLTSLAFAALLMAGCGKDNNPAVNSAPEFGQEAYTFKIAEDASSGDALGTVSATDSNEGDILAYSITTIQTDFIMNASTGEIILAADVALDFETVTSYSLQVQVNDGATPALTATAGVTVNVGDVNDNIPVFANTPYAFNITEDAMSGEEVGTVFSTDADAEAMLTYSLSGEGSAHFATTDGTDVASGEEVSVVVATGADLSSLASPVTITVTVSDGTHTATEEVAIMITAGNVAPVFGETAYTFKIAEDASSGDALGTVSATDSNEGDILAYSITTIQTDFIMNASTGEIILAADVALDFETVTSYSLQVQVNDGATPALTATAGVTVNVGDVNDNIPVFANTPYAFNITEDAMSGEEVGTVFSTDADAEAMLTYSLSGEGSAHFATTDGTDVASGEEVSVVVATGADLSSLASPVTITVTVSDGTHTATEEVAIMITAGNVAPVFGETAYTFEVAENAASGATVGMVSATDADGDDLAYSTTDTQTDFDVGASTGEITVATGTVLDREMTPSYMLEVEVSDGTHTATADVVVNVTEPGYDANANGLIDITTLEQLNAMRWDLDGNGEVDEATDADAYAAAFPGAAAFTVAPTGYELMADLDFSEAASYASGTVDKGWSEAEAGEGWDPIGYYVDDTDNAAFVATFSGNDNTLSNLYVNRGSENNIGLFGYTDAATVNNIGLEDVNITGGSRVGGLVGQNVNFGTGTSMLTACYATGNVTGGFYTGGLVGQNENSNSGTVTIENSYAKGNVEGLVFVGGLVGQNENSSSGTVTIENSYAEGNVEGLGDVGGLVGTNQNIGNGTVMLTASYATGDVTGGGNSVGGLVGTNQNIGNGTVMLTASYATGDVTMTGDGSGVGGLVGQNENSSSSGTVTIENSYAKGNVDGDRFVGGLVGQNENSSSGTITIENSYAKGNVEGFFLVGGLVGGNVNFGAGIVTTENSYAEGNVEGFGNVGGLVGINQNSGNGTVMLTACYATGNVTEENTVGGTGGLVGGNINSTGTVTIAACYATGDVTGGQQVGGLVGHNVNNSGTGTITVTASYATGAVTGNTDVGGLVGDNDNSSSTGTITITASYYDSEATGQSDTGKGEPKTAAELQMPMGYTGIYADWNVDVDGVTGADDPWDFGTSSQYPVLQADFNGDDSTADDVVRQRQ